MGFACRGKVCPLEFRSGIQIVRRRCWTGQKKTLGLWNTQVTDAGLVHLAGLTNLKGLDLDNTQVTDAGLVHLAGLTNLEELDLGGSQVTDAGQAELRKALPNCSIY